MCFVKVLGQLAGPLVSSGSGRGGVFFFKKISSYLHLHIHAWHRGESLLVLVYVSSYLAGYPRTAFKKECVPFFYVLSQQATDLSYTQKEYFLSKGKKWTKRWGIFALLLAYL